MWTENKLFQADLERLATGEAIGWAALEGKTVLVTGATGLIGRTLICALLHYNRRFRAGIKVAALVRDLDKAKAAFGKEPAGQEDLFFVQGTIEELPPIPFPVHYIVHGASPTASAYFARHPVETAMTNVVGTRNMLELAKEKGVSGFVYLSSMEVYGSPQTDAPIYEEYPTAVDPMSARSSYPQAKLMCENLCAGYCGEFGVPAKVVRLAQTMGPGVLIDDSRVFAQFGRAVMRGEDIILQTSGSSKRTYLYSVDAASAILTVLTRGESGQAYNAANPETYCSILEMAHSVSNLADPPVQVRVCLDEKAASVYSPVHCYNLRSDKLWALGWRPTASLLEMYKRMILAWEDKADT